ncbi:hypothetical protein MVEN_02595900 [Mycena venus]|uniref:F-box domain-containing protein n=1 Tax=Mycena venus TaxID=2733690 RepID=A0A8H6WU34_9AGAR|nr:hypothetical protein MVEN_02595900 [Mycena venus]
MPPSTALLDQSPSHDTSHGSKVFPILSLSPETIAEVFIQDVSDPEHTFAILRPVKLASVCRAWRTIALSTPRLWTFFEVSPPRGYQRAGVLLPIWMSRSGVLPIELKVHETRSCQSSYPFHLTDHASRWGILDLNCIIPLELRPLCSPPTFPNLHKLRLVSRDWCEQIFLPAAAAPLLRNVVLYSFRLANVILPWDQLTRLHIVDRPLAEYLQILEQSPRLRVLRAEIFHTPFFPYPASQPVITLSHLRFLALNGRALHLLDFLKTPVLTSIELIEPVSAMIRPLQAMLVRSDRARGLEHLSICSSNDGVMHLLADSFPDITRLTFRQSNVTRVNADAGAGIFFDRLASPTPTDGSGPDALLPSLEHITLRLSLQDRFPSNISAVLATTAQAIRLRARAEVAGVRRIATVCIEYLGAERKRTSIAMDFSDFLALPEDDVDSETLNGVDLGEILAVRESGVEVIVRAVRSWDEDES